MLDLSKPVQTRDGRSVRIYATDGEGRFSIHGRIGGAICMWTRDGLMGTGVCMSGDLVNVPARHTGWLNMYGPHSYHDTKKDADEAAACSNSRIACIKTEFAEGEGLS
jgi:hypothetical protein